MEVRSEQPFSLVMPKSPVSTQPSFSGMRLTVTPDGTAVYKPIATTTTSAVATNTTKTISSTISTSAPSSFHGGGASPSFLGGDAPSTAPVATIHGLNNIGIADPGKKKRGRPRKYGPDGSMALALATVSPTSASGPGAGSFSPLSTGQTITDLSASGDPMKKGRGRPRGSGKKQQLLALGSAGTGFIPHVITVKAGEDVSSKIMSFSQHGPRAICILSANGAISNVTLRQAATSGGTVTYEGRFEILSLSGSFLLSDSGGQRSRTGGLSVSLAGPDGRVLGGGVAGILTAASPVQVVVGSFITEGKKKPKPINLIDGMAPIGKLAPIGGLTTGGSSPPSGGTLSESSGGPPSPLHQSAATCINNSSQPILSSIPWK
ncbi:hypothetical protein HPP92_018348 [Vanilla planifolia]|uniref:AT-hook motif nuclear-localized protein n=1 Tax=Vanilla planifolia TaxID=51239 RepID=A0A835QE83_VANPL|nr:hypothetical protein HPP92_018348 [Vanilla planifolia]